VTTRHARLTCEVVTATLDEQQLGLIDPLQLFQRVHVGRDVFPDGGVRTTACQGDQERTRVQGGKSAWFEFFALCGWSSTRPGLTRLDSPDPTLILERVVPDQELLIFLSISTPFESKIFAMMNSEVFEKRCRADRVGPIISRCDWNGFGWQEDTNLCEDVVGHHSCHAR
jgi:hypothetical protein